MEAYRDQYATLFNNGRKVVVIGVSVDPDTTLASWARESAFPVLFASDTSGAVGRLYGAFLAKDKLHNRFLFVIDSTGKVAYRAIPFRVLAQQSYTDLTTAIQTLVPPPPPKPPGQ